uniref:Uncharacterized protein n=1 Tax=Leersia perrieri TaxID=77586 RepID=A0A0D9WWX5_9ORYZ
MVRRRAGEVARRWEAEAMVGELGKARRNYSEATAQLGPLQSRGRHPTWAVPLAQGSSEPTEIARYFGNFGQERGYGCARERDCGARNLVGSGLAAVNPSRAPGSRAIKGSLAGENCSVPALRRVWRRNQVDSPDLDPAVRPAFSGDDQWLKRAMDPANGGSFLQFLQDPGARASLFTSATQPGVGIPPLPPFMLHAVPFPPFCTQPPPPPLAPPSAASPSPTIGQAGSSRSARRRRVSAVPEATEDASTRRYYSTEEDLRLVCE